MRAAILALTAAGLALAAFAQDKPAAKPDDGAKPAKPAEAPKGDAAKPADGPLNFKMKTIEGEEVDLAAKYKGKVVLMVNVASRCGFTPQYEQLQALHEKYGSKGLAIVAFPSNDFGGQEPGTNEEIKEFCKTKYSVGFDLFSKVTVKGDDACPLYKYLTAADRGDKLSGPIKWNFTKFLVDRNGKLVQRFESRVKPDDKQVTSAIEELLGGK